MGASYKSPKNPLLQELVRNPSLSGLELGEKIHGHFVSVLCAPVRNAVVKVVVSLYPSVLQRSKIVEKVLPAPLDLFERQVMVAGPRVTY